MYLLLDFTKSENGPIVHFWWLVARPGPPVGQSVDVQNPAGGFAPVTSGVQFKYFGDSKTLFNSNTSEIQRHSWCTGLPSEVNLSFLFQEEFAPFVEGELYPSNMATSGVGSGGKVELFQVTKPAFFGLEFIPGLSRNPGMVHLSDPDLHQSVKVSTVGTQSI